MVKQIVRRILWALDKGQLLTRLIKSLNFCGGQTRVNTRSGRVVYPRSENFWVRQIESTNASTDKPTARLDCQGQVVKRSGLYSYSVRISAGSRSLSAGAQETMAM